MTVVFCHSGISEKSFHVPYSLPCFLPLLVIYCEFLWMERVVFPSASCSCILWYPRASLQNGKYDLESDVILVFPSSQATALSETKVNLFVHWMSKVKKLGFGSDRSGLFKISCIVVDYLLLLCELSWFISVNREVTWLVDCECWVGKEVTTCATLMYCLSISWRNWGRERSSTR